MKILIFLFLLILSGCENDETHNTNNTNTTNTCGNGIIEGNEQCDVHVPADRQCAFAGYESSTEAVCTEFCTIDYTLCSNCEGDCETESKVCYAGIYTDCRITDGCCQCIETPCESGVCADQDTCLDYVKPLVFMHFTDMHIGNEDVSDDFISLMSLSMTGIDYIFNSGDMVDDGGEASFWASYSQLIMDYLPYGPVYTEVAGNHDVKNDGSQSFLENSVFGERHGALYGHDSFADLCLVSTNTSAASLNSLNVNGYFDADQAELLTGVCTGPAIVTGHHPVHGIMDIKFGLDNMISVIESNNAAIYLCGHTHYSDIAWYENTLLVQGDSFGESGNYFIGALHPDGRVSLNELSASGPAALILAPSDEFLGGTNPGTEVVHPGDRLFLSVFASCHGSCTSVFVEVSGNQLELNQLSENIYGNFIQITTIETLYITLTVTDQSGTATHSISFSPTL
ncbi:metallophosphoesterase [Myxococcota bacterium]|nr:metallophosphoesterase [Myxococcota bacterium]MBU1380228.1 metallophosphoesterase [Myxococcota bacterium]MBU1499094.1 metallophosphoesterase [Myxococcota bacterium]